MCRASGRRCPGAGGRSTQNTRQAVSRAKTALRKAKQTGDLDQVTAARDRLATARAAHQDAKNTTTVHDTADQHGDVTDHHTPTTEDTSMGHQDNTPRGDDHQDQQPRTGFTVNNVNIVSGNATVGSQHDVTGDDSDVDADQVADQVAAALRKAAERVKRATERAKHSTGDGPTEATVNIARGDDVVAQQVGWQFGTTHVHHVEKSAPQTGDVTPPAGQTPRHDGIGPDQQHEQPQQQESAADRLFKTSHGTIRIGDNGRVEVVAEDGTVTDGLRAMGQLWRNDKRNR